MVWSYLDETAWMQNSLRPRPVGGEPASCPRLAVTDADKPELSYPRSSGWDALRCAGSLGCAEPEEARAPVPASMARTLAAAS